MTINSKFKPTHTVTSGLVTLEVVILVNNHYGMSKVQDDCGTTHWFNYNQVKACKEL